MKKLFCVIARSLRAKLLVIFLFVTIIPISILGIISYSLFYSSFWEQTVANVKNNLNQMNLTIDLIYEDTVNYLTMGENEHVIKYLETTKTTYQEAKEIINLFSVYRKAYQHDKRILNINIIGLNRKSISERKGVYWANHDYQMVRYIEAILNNDLMLSVSKNGNAENGSAQATRILSIGKKIIHPVRREPIGVIIIDVDSTLIESYYGILSIGQSGYFLIINDDGTIIYSPPAFDETEYIINEIIGATEDDYSIAEINGTRELIVTNTSETTGLKIIGVAPVKEIMSGAKSIMTLTLLLLLSAIFILIVLFYLISEMLTRPLRHIANSLKEVEKGDFSSRVDVKSADEIGRVASGFNKMASELDSLLQRIYKESENRKKAELQLLQAQINPHFLYNTLDTIVWMAEGGEKGNVIQLVKKLSGFFRIALSGGEEYVSIETELTHVKNYLEIQKMRYEDLFEYSIDVDSEIFNQKIVKLTVQPVVENALYHGLKERRTKGFISISGRRSNDHVILTVNDNGIGIEQHALAEIRHTINNTSNHEHQVDRHGFGLHNINMRLKLTYGPQWGVTIDSELNKGTEVSIKLPLLDTQ
jgi:two-component system sensor histidine kinase YesM